MLATPVPAAPCRSRVKILLNKYNLEFVQRLKGLDRHAPAQRAAAPIRLRGLVFSRGSCRFHKGLGLGTDQPDLERANMMGVMKTIAVAAVIAALAGPALAAGGGKGNDGLAPGHGGGGSGASDTNSGGVSGANGNQGNDKPVGNAGPGGPGCDCQSEG